MSAAPDPVHIARAVTELGEKRPVVASRAIYNEQGVKLIDKGVSIDSRLYERLIKHQLKEPLADSVSSEPSVTRTELREAAARLADSSPFFSAMLADVRLRDMLFEELQQVPLPSAVAFQLTLLRETQAELWLHSLRSALTAGWLAARSGYTRHDVRMLAAAGLVHDLGMLHLDPVLLAPEIALSRERRRQLYSHPLVSVVLLERHHEYPRELLSAVLEHHEALDGSGYPRHVGGATVSPWGRVLSLTEVVTAMFGAGHPAPALRLSLVLRMNRHRYDADLVREVMKVLPAVRESWTPASPGDPIPNLQTIDRLLRAWPERVAGLSAARCSATSATPALRVRSCGRSSPASSGRSSTPSSRSSFRRRSGNCATCRGRPGNAGG